MKISEYYNNQQHKIDKEEEKKRARLYDYSKKVLRALGITGYLDIPGGHIQYDYMYHSSDDIKVIITGLVYGEDGPEGYKYTIEATNTDSRKVVNLEDLELIRCTITK